MKRNPALHPGVVLCSSEVKAENARLKAANRERYTPASEAAMLKQAIASFRAADEGMVIASTTR